MRSIQTTSAFPLSSVKPLDGLMAYRSFCLATTRKALERSRTRRTTSPVDGVTPLELLGDIDGIPYARCPSSGSIFLAELPSPSEWADVLRQVSQYRHSPKTFHADLAQSRTDHVYAPKLEWIQDALRLQGLHQPKVLEVVTSPSDFTALLQDSGLCSEVVSIEETDVAHRHVRDEHPGQADVAVLLESLDRIDDPFTLLRGLIERVKPGGLLFATGLVASGFDMATLGLRNRYLYPPDRANCFSLQGLSVLLKKAGCSLLEVSTPGVLDVEIVSTHLHHDPSLQLSQFERSVVEADEETRKAFQTFLQQQGLSSFARIVARIPS